MGIEQIQAVHAFVSVYRPLIALLLSLLFALYLRKAFNARADATALAAVGLFLLFMIA